MVPIPAGSGAGGFLLRYDASTGNFVDNLGTISGSYLAFAAAEPRHFRTCTRRDDSFEAAPNFIPAERLVDLLALIGQQFFPAF